MKRLRYALLALSLALALTPAIGRADPLDDQVREIAKRLQCPVCQSVSVADSPSTLAEQMRGIIRKKLEAGESPDQIVQYFVERYGDGVLIEPPRRGLGLAVWWAPVVILAGGAGLLVALLRAWVRPRAAAPAERAVAGPPRDEFDERARRELEHYLRGRESGAGGR